MFPSEIWIVLGICALMCSIGFYKFVYFLSVGYGFAVCGAGLAILFIFGKTITPITMIMCVLFMVYGIRLGGFLLWREIKSAAYRKTLASATKTEKPMPIFVKVAIWVCCSIMYVLQVSPVFYRAVNGDNGNIFAIIGAVIMLFGIILESVADKQKSAAKAINSKRFCDTGLYKIVRCPNYLGEITFWTGVLVSGIGVLQGGQWVIGVIGYVLIVYVMLNGAKRLEKRQNKNYGQDPEYQAYVAKTPIIFPFVPLYSLENSKIII